MFDANMRHLCKGLKFFAEVHAVRGNSPLVNEGVKSGDILLCTMLSIGNYNPRIKVHFPNGRSIITRHWDHHDEDKLLDTMLVFSGILKDDGTFGSFIEDCWKTKAQNLMEKFKKAGKRKLIKATDDWYPCFPQNMVELSFAKLQRDKEDKTDTYRVAVWGMDDMGMDKDFHSDDPTEALALYNKLASIDSVSTEYLTTLGFESF